MATSNLESKEIWGTESDPEFAEIAAKTPEQIAQLTKMLQNNMRAMKSDMNSLDQQIKEQGDDIKDNQEKVKLNKQLPYLVANVVEVRVGRRRGGGARERARSRARTRVGKPPPSARLLRWVHLTDGWCGACLPLQLLDLEKEEEEDEIGAAMDEHDTRVGKSCVIKTTSRQVRRTPGQAGAVRVRTGCAA